MKKIDFVKNVCHTPVMKINPTDYNLEEFKIQPVMVCGVNSVLVTPNHVGTKFNQSNKIFRSSVWQVESKDTWNLLSASFPKFFNWGEQPDLSPVPTSLKNTTVVEKLDGSTLIVSKYKGQYILRTRGTVDASTMANGHELELFKDTILSKLQDNNDTWNYSVLFEWLSPINKIVLSYGDEPMWKLVGFVDHSDYSLATQDMLDLMAKKYDLLRPEIYTFSDVNDLLQNVDQWKGKEGVCVYSKNDQSIHKVKGAWYLALHHMKSELSNVEKVLDVWLEQGMPDYNTFYNYIFTTFDYELAEQCKGMISRICDARKDVDQIVSGMTEFVDTKVRKLTARKDQAQLVLGAYGNTNRASFVFALLDGKTLTKDQLKKLMFQVIKN